MEGGSNRKIITQFLRQIFSYSYDSNNFLIAERENVTQEPKTQLGTNKYQKPDSDQETKQTFFFFGQKHLKST